MLLGVLLSLALVATLAVVWLFGAPQRPLARRLRARRTDRAVALAARGLDAELAALLGGLEQLD